MLLSRMNSMLFAASLCVLIVVGASAPSEVCAQTTSGEIRFEIAEGTRAFYRVREQLVGISFLNDAVGVAEGISGTVVVRADGTGDARESRLVLDLATFSSVRCVCWPAYGPSLQDLGVEKKKKKK